MLDGLRQLFQLSAVLFVGRIAMQRQQIAQYINHRMHLGFRSFLGPVLDLARARCGGD